MAKKANRKLPASRARFIKHMKDPAVRKAFLDQLSILPNVKYACAIAGVGVTSAYDYRANNPKFAEEWDAALATAVGVLEEEARRRAVEGRVKKVWYQGEEVGVDHEPSDFLMSRMLEAHHDAYKNKHEISGPGGEAIVIKWKGEE